MNTYGVIGLGYVGLPLALALAKHHKVIGYDIQAERVAELQNHHDRHGLCSAQELKQSHFSASSDPQQLKDMEVYFICVPTPTCADDSPDLQPLLQATQMVGHALKPNDLIIFESTVYPGTTQDHCIPVLEQSSGLKHLKDFHVGYSPERINPGDATHPLTAITKIIAADGPATLEKLRTIYSRIFADVFPVSSIATAEAIKLLENTQRDVNIALMNEFARIMHACHLDMHEVLAGARTKWSFIPFKPGLVGGHCIAVDPYYLSYRAQQLGLCADLTLQARRINQDMTQYLIDTMHTLLHQHRRLTHPLKIALLGLSYKENVLDLRNSLSLKLARELEERGHRCFLHDPLMNADESIMNLHRWEELHDMDLICLLVGHDVYLKYGINKIISIAKAPPILMDIPNLFYDEGRHHHSLIYWNL